MFRELGPGVRFVLILTVATGLIYPLLVTGLCQLIFPVQANGSMIKSQGRIVGSSLIGQNFSKLGYFHPRPSLAGAEGYDGLYSGGSNLGPTSQKLMHRIRASIAEFRRENPDFRGKIPADIVTASASGLDPHISPAAAEAQVDRVARARGVAAGELEALVRAQTRGAVLGFLGEPRVNVLALNLALDRRFGPCGR